MQNKMVVQVANPGTASLVDNMLVVENLSNKL